MKRLKNLKGLWIAGLCLLLWMPSNLMAQGDCPWTAEQVTQCGFGFTGRNDNVTACGYACGGSCPQCVGGGSDAGIDNDCGTDGPGTNCGCDIAASIENNMFWTFTATQSCTYSICFTFDNCCCTQGAGASFIQVAIVQQSGGSITNYHVSDGSNTSNCCGNTQCYNIAVNPADGDMVIMLDGNAGTECDVTLVVDTVAGTGCASCQLLPVNITSFTATSLEEAVQLDWSTDQEQNIREYVIERSREGVNFEAIGKVAAVGNSNETLNYSYADRQASSAWTYYRIKHVDLDGAVGYSAVQRVMQPGQSFNLVAMGPNPVKDKLMVTLNSQTASTLTVEVLDIQGRVIHRMNKDILTGRNGFTINADYLASGVNFVRLRDQSGTYQVTRRIVK